MPISDEMIQRVMADEAKFIGATLIDWGQGAEVDRIVPVPRGGFRTVINAIECRRQPSGGGHYLEISGDDFGCGTDTSLVTAHATPMAHGWYFNGFQGHRFEVQWG